MAEHQVSKMKTSELIVGLVEYQRNIPGPGRELRIVEKLGYFEKQNIDAYAQKRTEMIKLYSDELDKRIPIKE